MLTVLDIYEIRSVKDNLYPLKFEYSAKETFHLRTEKLLKMDHYFCI